jgi:BlaI family transcriptional regulator, penicillinase repressor
MLTKDRLIARHTSATVCSVTKPLSELEHLVMDVVWARNSATAEDVRTALSARHPMKESTTRTILKRLEEKGYVRHTMRDRVNVYTGLVAPQRVAAKAMRHILDRFCGGSVEQLLVGMVTSEVIDEDELQRLARRIADRKKREER